tara:strand:+ start:64 stop:276 length:213 start_codon:yes stop_codon:yes gene_type:complete
LTPEKVQKLLDQMENEIKEIKNTALKFSWYMRGGVSYEDVLNMSDDERTMIGKIIDDNLETTKKSQLPFF